jgi:hypothetical protein
MEYIEVKTEADREVATTIVSNILDESQKGKVDVIPAPHQSDLGNA